MQIDPNTQMQGSFSILELDRIKTTVGFLEDGKFFNVLGLQLGMDDDSHMYVTGWFRPSYFNTLTKTASLEELNKVKRLFVEMAEASPELKKFIERKTIKYNLCYDDSGKTAIPICSDTNGEIDWSWIFTKV